MLTLCKYFGFLNFICLSILNSSKPLVSENVEMVFCTFLFGLCFLCIGKKKVKNNIVIIIYPSDLSGLISFWFLKVSFSIYFILLNAV